MKIAIGIAKATVIALAQQYHSNSDAIADKIAISHTHLIHDHQPNFLQPLLLYQTINERVSFFYGCYVDGLPLPSLSWWEGTFAGCILLNQKVKFYGKFA